MQLQNVWHVRRRSSGHSTRAKWSLCERTAAEKIDINSPPAYLTCKTWATWTIRSGYLAAQPGCEQCQQRPQTLKCKKNLLTTEVRRILRRYTCNAPTDAYGFRAIVLVELQKMFTKVHVEVRTVALHIGRILSLHIGHICTTHTHTHSSRFNDQWDHINICVVIFWSLILKILFKKTPTLQKSLPQTFTSPIQARHYQPSACQEA